MTGTRKYGVVIALAAVAALLSATGSRILADRAEDADSIGTIRTSYAFDVKDKGKVMKFGDAGFIGQVLGVERTEQENATTVWRVGVKNSFKGTSRSEVLVRQLGYVDTEGRAHVAEEQPMLQAGERYLLITTYDAVTGEYTLVTGPISSVRTPPGQEKKLIQGYVDAAADK